MLDRPKINRKELLLQEDIARQVRPRFDQVCALVKENERLGQPVRDGAYILIPIVANGDQDVIPTEVPVVEMAM